MTSDRSASRRGERSRQKVNPVPPHRDLRLMYTYLRHPNVSIKMLINDTTTAISPRHEREVFIVRNAWYPDDVVKYCSALKSGMDPLKRQVYFLSNTPEIHQARIEAGFNSTYVNFACFIDDEVFAPAEPPEPKQYDAVYIARFFSQNGQEMKRHFLTRDIPRLALLDPVFGGNDPAYKKAYTEAPNCAFTNQHRLEAKVVAKILRQSRCGLALSELEGVCRASSEYLLCGIPVVSTTSKGGRDVWYDSYNSIVVDQPTPESIREAVQHFIDNPPDARRIREGYLRKAALFRERFVKDVLGRIFSDYDVPLDAGAFLQANPLRWWPETPPWVLARARMTEWHYRFLRR